MRMKCNTCGKVSDYQERVWPVCSCGSEDADEVRKDGLPESAQTAPGEPSKWWREAEANIEIARLKETLKHAAWELCEEEDEVTRLRDGWAKSEVKRWRMLRCYEAAEKATAESLVALSSSLSTVYGREVTIEEAIALEDTTR